MEITRRTALKGATFAAAAAATAAAATAATAEPAVAAAAAPPGSGPSVERWGIHEIVLRGPDGGNPFVDVNLTATFRQGSTAIRVPGFYDGGGVYRIRFSPSAVGLWRWTTESNARSLRSSGRVTVTDPGAGNHGPVGVVPNGYHFVYADGTPFRQIGTTSYSWALQSDDKCGQTLATLGSSPFNKIRMLVFPNVASAVTDPWVRTGAGLKDWDPTRFDPAYFQRYEDRIQKLLQLGIQADVVLYHPYDPDRGYSDMKRADDERYLRYVAARWGAYRNVWWSMANEFDSVKSKTTDDWDHLFQVLQAADPHDRLRSIHNQNVYYDARRPWITHASVQNAAAAQDSTRAQLHRDFALKPVIFDEVAYEGNIPQRWGALSGEELTRRFWTTLVGGTYCGHGETIDPEHDPNTSWLGQGGTLRGTSAPRLAFLKSVMEDGPAPGIDLLQPFWAYDIGGVDGQYYLKYFGDAAPASWDVVLPKSSAVGAYRADIIDTWNMTITPAGTFTMALSGSYDMKDPARPTLRLPGTPWTAVRIVKA